MYINTAFNMLLNCSAFQQLLSLHQYMLADGTWVKLDYRSNKLPQTIASVILSSSCYTGVALKCFSDKCGFNWLFDAQKLGCSVVMKS